MIRFRWPAVARLTALFVFSIFIFFGGECLHCSFCIDVWVQNDTMDNFRIDQSGLHIMQGESAKIATLSNVEKFLKPSYTFTISRSQGGTLAEVTVVGTKWQNDHRDGRYVDTIVFEENPRNYFSVYSSDNYVDVDIKNLSE